MTGFLKAPWRSLKRRIPEFAGKVWGNLTDGDDAT